MKKILLFLRDCMEIYLPIVAFVLMFVAFILQVIFRYMFNHPLTWTNDLIVAGFCWTVILGSCYTMRQHGHVQFTLLYEAYSPKIAAFARLAGNVLLIVTFAILVIPSVRFAHFQSFQRTAALRINLCWIFLPFSYFLLSIIGYSIRPCVEDIKILAGIRNDSEDHDKGKSQIPVLKKRR